MPLSQWQSSTTTKYTALPSRLGRDTSEADQEHDSESILLPQLVPAGSALNGRRVSRSLGRRVWQKHGTPWLRAASAAAPFLLLCAVVIVWSKSDMRRVNIIVMQMSCLPIPWWYFYFPSTDVLYFDTDNLYVPPSPKQQVGRPDITMVQVCSHPYADSVYLAALLESHTAYARRHGYEYTLLGQGDSARQGMWRKTEALAQAVQKQLDRPKERQAEWLFYSDSDTFFANPVAPLAILLPPSTQKPPFILISEDWNGLNAGTFFLRVDPRSTAFVQQVLTFPTHHANVTLPFAEQSAMLYLAQEQHLVDSGEMVYIPRDWINCYDGERASRADHDSIQLHFPRLDRKVRELLPLLDKQLAGQLSIDEKELLAAGRQIAEDAQRFWQSKDP